MEYSYRTLPSRKRVALVAHDNRKQDLIDWVGKNSSVLAKHELHATGTTGDLLEATLNIPVKRYLSGPMGGDQQIGSAIALGEVDALVFFWDPFEPLPHDPDVKALLRIAAVWNIPVACNRATADMLIHSDEFSAEYKTKVPDYKSYQSERSKT